MESITSRENPKIKKIIKLNARGSVRDDTNLFVAEGARLCRDAVLSGVIVREALFTEKALEKYEQARFFADNHASISYIISDSVCEKISGTKNPQGVFAVCEKPDLKRPGKHPENARYFLLAGLQDPGNLGSIIRTAEAFKMDGICISSDCPGIFSPKVLRASMGGVFRLNIWDSGDMLKEVARLKDEGVNVYAAGLSGNAEGLADTRFLGACAVLLGNEGAGLCETLEAMCSGVIKIPMAGAADSLGVAAAAGIFAWEMTK